jgi:electron transfer flavoprotein beta subunit
LEVLDTRSRRPGVARLGDPPLKIIVSVKLVPDTNADKRIDPSTKRLVRTGVDTVLNPFDEYAIEAALQLRDKLADGSTVTIVSMVPESGKEVVRKALAMGADDAVMLSDPALAGSDLWGTAYVLAAGLRKVGFDLVLCGTQSTDAITGDVPGMLAEFLGVPGLTNARELAVADGRLRVKRETDTGYQTVSAPLPALASVTKSANEPRYPSLKGIMGAKKKDIKTLAIADLGLTLAVGSDGARTEVLDLATPPAREKGRTVTASDGAEGARAVVDFLKSRKLL